MNILYALKKKYFAVKNWILSFLPCILSLATIAGPHRMSLFPKGNKNNYESPLQTFTTADFADNLRCFEIQPTIMTSLKERVLSYLFLCDFILFLLFHLISSFLFYFIRKGLWISSSFPSENRLFNVSFASFVMNT